MYHFIFRTINTHCNGRHGQKESISKNKTEKEREILLRLKKHHGRKDCLCQT